MKKILCSALFLMLFSIVSMADIARPEKPSPKPPAPSKSIDSLMEIRIDKNAKEAKLLIPNRVLSRLKSEEEAETGGMARTQTIISGAFLSLAIVFGGLWIVRSPKTNRKIKAASLILAFAVSGTFAAMTYANVGPPSKLRSISGKLFNKEAFGAWDKASGKIKIEVSDEAYNVTLVVPDGDSDKKSTEEE